MAYSAALRRSSALKYFRLFSQKSLRHFEGLIRTFRPYKIAGEGCLELFFLLVILVLLAIGRQTSGLSVYIRSIRILIQTSSWDNLCCSAANLAPLQPPTPPHNIQVNIGGGGRPQNGLQCGFAAMKCPKIFQAFSGRKVYVAVQQRGLQDY